ncbi:MAG: hypothetical protein RLZZ142_2487 [Verrucomicrobiota bacterium]
MFFEFLQQLEGFGLRFGAVRRREPFLETSAQGDAVGVAATARHGDGRPDVGCFVVLRGGLSRFAKLRENQTALRTPIDRCAGGEFEGAFGIARNSRASQKAESQQGLRFAKVVPLMEGTLEEAGRLGGSPLICPEQSEGDEGMGIEELGAGLELAHLVGRIALNAVEGGEVPRGLGGVFPRGFLEEFQSACRIGWVGFEQKVPERSACKRASLLKRFFKIGPSGDRIRGAGAQEGVRETKGGHARALL